MANVLYRHKLKTKLFLFSEMLMISLFLIITMIEIGYTSYMKNLYNNSVYKYYFWMINERLIKDSYVAHVYTEENGQCKDNYSNDTFYTINQISNVQLKDVTNTTYKYDPTLDNKIMNTTFYGYSFYEYDISEIGNTNITLKYSYNFYKWRNKYFCRREIFLDKYADAFQLIPKEDDCERPYLIQPAIDCGVYLDSYRFCIQVSYLSYKNGTLLIDNKYEKENKNYSNLCPLKWVNFDNKDKSSNFKLIYRNTDNEFKDKSLFSNLELIKFDKFAKIDNPEQDMSEHLSHLNSYIIGHENGFHDSFNYVVDSYLFNDFFFENQFKKEVMLNKTSIKKPEFLEDINGIYYYYPYDKFNKVKISLKISFFPVLSKKCYFDVFKINGRYDVFNIINSFKLNWFNDSSSTLFAWLFAKLFISLWCNFKIRFLILYDKLKLCLERQDEISEKTTFFTYKTLESIVLLILLMVTSHQRNMFNSIKTYVKLIAENKCFDDLTTKAFNNLYDLIINLKTQNDIVLTLLILSVVIECICVLIFLLYLNSDTRAIRVENIDELDKIK